MVGGQLRIKKSEDFSLLNSRGQLRIKQMTFMLLAVAIFFVIVGLFALIFAFNNLKTQATQLNAEEAISIASRMAGETEFSCGQDYCINADKLMALKNMPVYSDLWQDLSIEVCIFDNSTEKCKNECTLANYPECNFLKVVESNETNQIYTSLFVSVCRKAYMNSYVYDKCKLGTLLLGYKKEE